MSSGAEVVFNTIVPPGLTPVPRTNCTGRASPGEGEHIVCTYFDENFLNLVPAEQVEGLYRCLDWYQELSDPPAELLSRYKARFPGSATLTSGSGCTGHYRALKLWEAAVKEAGTSNAMRSSERSITRGSLMVLADPPRWLPASATSA